MFPSNYITLSSQLALQRRLDTIAHNIANAGTAGFRAEEIRFEEVVRRIGDNAAAFVSRGQTHISERIGPTTKTGNALDIAIDGRAWLSIMTPEGIVFTRDGRLRTSDTGELQTLGGHAVLDVSGAPIQLDPQAETPTIARDGMIAQGGRTVGAIGLFEFSDGTRFTRRENAGVVGDTVAVPMLDFSRAGLVQGFVEGSNVDSVREMTELITVHRLFDASAAAVSESDATLNEAIRILGGAA